MSRLVIAVSRDNGEFIVGEAPEVADRGAGRTDLTYWSEEGQLLRPTAEHHIAESVSPGAEPFEPTPWRTTQGEALHRLNLAVLALARRAEVDGGQEGRDHARWLRSLATDLPTFAERLAGQGRIGAVGDFPRPTPVRTASQLGIVQPARAPYPAPQAV